MNLLLAIVLLVLAAVAQVAVLPPLLGGGVSIDLVLLLVVAWGIISGVQEGLLWGLIGGLILDVLSAVPFGMTAVVLGAMGLLGGLRPFPLLRSSVLSALVIAAVATGIYDGLLMGLLAIFGREWRWLDVFREIVVPAALMNAVVMVPIYWILSRLRRQREPEKAGKKVARRSYV